MDEVITISTQGAIITENDHMNITVSDNFENVLIVYYSV